MLSDISTDFLGSQLSDSKKRILLWLTICFSISQLASSQLVINIRNRGGEIFQERITANTLQDTNEVEYRNTDGSLITQVIDFKYDVQIFSIILPGEEERGDQNQYQSFCFVTALNRSDFITSDAMSKLRQRNPRTIRQAEEDKRREIYEMDLSISLKRSSIISPNIAKLCDHVRGINATKTIAREIDLEAWTSSKALNRDVIALTSAFTKLSSHTPKPVRCNRLRLPRNYLDQKANISSALSKLLSKPCRCKLELCIPWYPCALKYCKMKDTLTNKVITNKCGIRTCKICRVFHFDVDRKQNCLWDEYPDSE